MANMIDKYGVPLPGGGRISMKQPKAKYKFRVIFFGFGVGDDGNYITVDTNTVGAVHVEHEDVTVHSYNSSAHYKGKYTWSPIEVAFRDSVGNMSAKAVYNQMRKEFNYYTQESRMTDSQFKFEMWIQELDGSNSESTTNLFEGTLSTWVCQGCFISDSNFGEWDYSSSDAQVITMTVRPDGCAKLGPEGQPFGDEVSGNGTPENATSISGAQTAISSTSITDSNFYNEQ
ncbi:hypothetical protein EJP02_201 [Escherichia phage EJP2]|nr:hypothetical protein EJP02_201 [Escherichia phage EJP2]